MIDKAVVNVNALAFLSTFDGTSNKRNVLQSLSNIQFILVHNFNVGQIKTTHTAGLQQVLYIIICIFEKIYFRSAVVKVDQNIFFNGALHCI